MGTDRPHPGRGKVTISKEERNTLIHAHRDKATDFQNLTTLTWENTERVEDDRKNPLQAMQTGQTTALERLNLQHALIEARMQHERVENGNRERRGSGHDEFKGGALRFDVMFLLLLTIGRLTFQFWRPQRKVITRGQVIPAHTRNVTRCPS